MMINKFWIRWGCIIFICVIYFAVILFFNFTFSLNLSINKETMYMGGNLTSSQCGAFVDGLVAEHDNASLVSFVGFLICVPLILFIFNKIR